MLNDLLAGKIKSEQLPDLIRYCFTNGIQGQFGCYNPHWWINIYKEYVTYTYADDAESESSYDDYEKYDNPEDLIAENKILFTGDEWWFKPANR